MKLFTKRKESNAAAKHNTISKDIRESYKRLQGGWANWMMKRTEKFSRRTWFVLLVFFVLFTSTYSVYLAINAFTGKTNHSISITPIKKLRHATETGETNSKAPEVSEAEHNRIKKFRVYMDSLARSPTGKALYDSITSQRPGLMDSVRFIENYYQQVKQK